MLTNKNEFTSNEKLYSTSFSEWVSTQIAMYESNETLERAMKEVDKGHYEEAKKLVKQNDDYIRSKPAAIQQAPAMLGAASVNESYHKKLDEVETMSTEDIKYMQKESKNSNYKVRSKK